MNLHWLQPRASGPPSGSIHLYAVYEAFGIPSARWLDTLTRQVPANEAEREAIRRYDAGRPSGEGPVSPH